jgi:hypothetical protein
VRHQRSLGSTHQPKKEEQPAASKADSPSYRAPPLLLLGVDPLQERERQRCQSGGEESKDHVEAGRAFDAYMSILERGPPGVPGHEPSPDPTDDRGDDHPADDKAPRDRARTSGHGWFRSDHGVTGPLLHRIDPLPDGISSLPERIGALLQRDRCSPPRIIRGSRSRTPGSPQPQTASGWW